MNETLLECIKLLEAQHENLSGEMNIMKLLVAQQIGVQVSAKLSKLASNPANINMTVKRIQQNGRQ